MMTAQHAEALARNHPEWAGLDADRLCESVLRPLLRQLSGPWPDLKLACLRSPHFQRHPLVVDLYEWCAWRGRLATFNAALDGLEAELVEQVEAADEGD